MFHSRLGNPFYSTPDESTGAGHAPPCHHLETELLYNGNDNDARCDTDIEGQHFENNVPCYVANCNN